MQIIAVAALAIAALAVVLPGSDAQLPAPADVCFQCRMRRNHKDLYADETDCHYYYQCHYVNSTYALGYRRKCPEGQFWHEPELTCYPEGDVPCVDLCLNDDTVAQRGCYAGSGCRQFFFCSNTGSNGMCCPSGSRFNPDSCGCEEDAQCNDFCEMVAPAVPTSVAPVVQVNATVCIDSFGSAVMTVAGEANAYILIGDDGEATEKKYCQTPLLFELASCRCNVEGDATTPAPTPYRKAILYLPFDEDTKDKSEQNYATALYDGADRDTTTAAVGAGSLAINNGYLSIPGLKSYDFRQSGSWCAFFRGSGAGGVLSNNKDSASSEFSTIFGTESSTSFVAKVAPRQAPTVPRYDPIVVQSDFSSPANGWNHFCTTFDGNAVRLYVNGAVQTEFWGGFISIAHCPYVVGHDQEMGHFNGNIDEVLLTGFAMTEEEVNAHRAGDRAFLEARGFF